MSKEKAIALYQPMLVVIANRILNSLQDAEDVVQDTLMKWLSVDDSTIQNTKAYLIRSVTNNCLSHLQAIASKKTELIDNLNPGKLIDIWKETEIIKFDLETELSSALNTVQNKLAPVEKAIFLLRETFDLHYEEIQDIVGKKSEHCRQLFRRAKLKISEEVDSISVKTTAPHDLLKPLKEAIDFGNLNGLISKLKSEISVLKKDSCN